MHTICFIRSESKSDVDAFLKVLDEGERKKTVALIQRVADHGPPRNEQICRSIQSVKGLYELKPGRVRIPFFYQNGRIILTHAFFKKGQSTPQREIDRAVRLRNEIGGSR